MMIKNILEEFHKTKKYFPSLDLVDNETRIVGKLGFCCHYKDDGYDGISKWIIKSCNLGENDCIEDFYEIEINLNNTLNGPPVVLETAERIRKLADSLGKPLEDVHLNSAGSCCLGIFPPFERLSKFVMEAVYPYFVWQAYYEKYRDIPPCGECPHNWKEAIAVRINEEENNLLIQRNEQRGQPEGSNRNKPCPCGSGRKYKKCCFDSDRKKDTEINKTMASLQYLKNLPEKQNNPKINVK